MAATRTRSWPVPDSASRSTVSRPRAAATAKSPSTAGGLVKAMASISPAHSARTRSPAGTHRSPAGAVAAGTVHR